MQDIWLPDETVVAATSWGFTQVTVVIAVGGSRVRFCVAVNVVSTCEVAVIVTALYCCVGPGITAGAVYKPPAVMEPKLSPVGAPVAPLTDQFTRVLLSFKTVAVH